MQGRTRLGLAALVLAATLGAAPALAADITVTGLGDEINASCSPDGTQCTTLRQALAEATDLPNSTIHVPAGRTSLSGALTVASDVTIVGAGARDTVIQGSGAARVFVVNQGHAVMFAGLTMTGGRDTSGTGGGDLLVGDSATVSLDHASQVARLRRWAAGSSTRQRPS
jgi:hypothetical protein